ncbi:MAG: hypothetical protein KJ578_08810 [Bacteroidetes bacterium]|jgi:hypothetical protein|nr:hypothetical protein [Bacteroidota bacterium]MBU1578784.1 hypothetical protein [Bacteroidota bacterium]MBU2466160.1 hypothetical protein [Bacteroidota bacterium]MBU2557861.1 hypothetical protein [Bacteroidota bacterium]MDA3944216.1 hypothetical protein [Bacteroidota bacterium]
MVDKLSKYAGWVLYALLAVSAVLAVLFYTETLSTDNFMQWAYVLLIASVIIAIASPVYGFIMAPKNAIKLLVILGVVAIIAFVAYSIAGNTFSETRLELLKINAQTSRNVGMGLYFTYFAGAVAVLSIVFSSVIKIFK